jgi:O-antigen/teichoic acid export membrane protein
MSVLHKRILLKNALSNVIRGGATAIVALVLPVFLTRSMSVAAFSVWSLVLQLAAYVSYLDFGIQTAVARYVAYDLARNDVSHLKKVVSTAFVALAAMAALASSAVFISQLFFSHLFKQIPAGLQNQFRFAFAAVAISAAIGLPLSVFGAIFVGLQKNEVPALVIGGSRLIGAFMLIILAANGFGLNVMGSVFGLVNLSGALFLWWMYHRSSTDIFVSFNTLSFPIAKELTRYCASLSVWIFSMVIVTGLDLVLVGLFEFSAVGAYAIAAGLVAFLAGLQNAIFNAMISPAAALHAHGESECLGRDMIAATRYGMFVLLCTGLPLVVFAHPLLRIWVGREYANAGTQVLQILVIANVIRLTATPYAVTLISTGQQGLITITPSLEAVTNIFVSVLFGLKYGAIGVAWGTLAGALVGVSGNLFYNMRRTLAVEFRIADYIRDGLLRPVICAVPLTLYFLVQKWNILESFLPRSLALTAACLATVWMVWLLGLVDEERSKLRLRGVPQIVGDRI